MKILIKDINESRRENLAHVLRAQGAEVCDTFECSFCDMLLYHKNDPFPEKMETSMILVYSGGGVSLPSLEEHHDLPSKENVYWLDQGVLSNLDYLEKLFTSDKCRSLFDFVREGGEQPIFINGPLNNYL